MDGLAVAPLPEGVAPELPAFVGDDVLGRAIGVTDRSIQKALNVIWRRMVTEDCETNHGT